MEIFETVLAIMNIAVIIPLLFVVGVLILMFVFMVATKILDRAPRRTIDTYERGRLGAT